MSNKIQKSKKDKRVTLNLCLVKTQKDLTKKVSEPRWDFSIDWDWDCWTLKRFTLLCGSFTFLFLFFIFPKFGCQREK